MFLFFPPFAYLNQSSSGMHLPTSWTPREHASTHHPFTVTLLFLLTAYNLSKLTRLIRNGPGPWAIKGPITLHVVCIMSWRLCTDHSAVTSLRCLLPVPVLPPTPTALSALAHGTTASNNAPELETWELSSVPPHSPPTPTTLDGHHTVLIVLSEIPSPSSSPPWLFRGPACGPVYKSPLAWPSGPSVPHSTPSQVQPGHT